MNHKQCGGPGHAAQTVVYPVEEPNIIIFRSELIALVRVFVSRYVQKAHHLEPGACDVLDIILERHYLKSTATSHIAFASTHHVKEENQCTNHYFLHQICFPSLNLYLIQTKR